MMRMATHFKGALWGSQDTLEGTPGTSRTADWPLLQRGGQPFFCALMSALCEDVFIPLRACRRKDAQLHVLVATTHSR